MGKQRGMLPVEGSLQEMTFYKMGDKYFVRSKSSLDKKRVKTDPKFTGSRKASEEFGRAATAAKQIRDAFAATGAQLSDTRILVRLIGKLVGLMGTDVTNMKGERRVEDCDLTNLRGFEWNKEASVSSLLLKPVNFSIDSAKGNIEVKVPALKPKQDLKTPASATHYEIIMSAAAIDFAGKDVVSAKDSTGWLPLKSNMAAKTLSAALQKPGGKKLLAGVGIRFGQEVNGEVHPLEDKTTRGFVMG